MKNKIKLLNIEIDNICLDDLLAECSNGIVVTPNVDHIVKLQHDRDFYKVYQSADYVICDSKIIGLGLKFLGSPIKQVIPGSSFFPAYYNFHKLNDKVRIFLLGAANGVANEAKKKINDKVGREIIVGAHSPSYGFENNEIECDEIIDIINKTNATVLVVGVGAPKQEKWILKYRHKLININLFMGLGATLDFEAGNLDRAPKFYQNVGLEWFYRLIKEPRRLSKRYLIDDLPFFGLLLKQKMSLYRNPFE